MKRIYIGLVVLVFGGLSNFAQTSETLKWYTMQEAIALNKTAPKKILVDVFTDWCGWCKVMDKNTFQHTTIAAIVDKYFYAVKFNAEKGDSLVFKGVTYKISGGPNAKTYHSFTNVLMNGQSNGYPTICYMDEDMNIIQAISGYQTADQIEPILEFFGTDSYKTTDWETFTKGFKSALK